MSVCVHDGFGLVVDTHACDNQKTILWSPLFPPPLCVFWAPYTSSYVASPSHSLLTPSILQLVNHRSDYSSPVLYF